MAVPEHASDSAVLSSHPRRHKLAKCGFGDASMDTLLHTSLQYQNSLHTVHRTDKTAS